MSIESRVLMTPATETHSTLEELGVELPCMDSLEELLGELPLADSSSPTTVMVEHAEARACGLLSFAEFEDHKFFWDEVYTATA